ncbi:MAG: FG-GAP-like repeat-containing protein, partial [Opitutaceae bacterium]
MSDGTTRATSVVAAAEAWNAQTNVVQIVPQIAPVSSGADGDGVNQVFFAASPYGYSWDSSTLAITTTWYEGTKRLEADVIFNTAYTWDSYRGALQPGSIDIRRVALHELGHVLGLTHPDQAVPPQNVSAIMNSAVSNLESLQDDDIEGVQSLYGAPSGSIAPTITSQPQPQSIYIGFSTTFSVTATGTAPLVYHWQVYLPAFSDWAAISDSFLYSGPSTATLTILGANGVFGANSHLDGDYYRCVVSNGVSSVASNAALLTVSVHPPVVEFSPTNMTANEGSSAQFRVTVEGTNPIAYQWQRLPAGSSTWVDLTNGGNYANANDLILTVNNTALVMSGDNFRCVVRDPGGTATSDPAALTVIPYVIPTLTLQPQNLTVIENSNLSFTVAATGAIPLTYVWQISLSNAGLWTNLSDAGGYSGTTTSTLALTNVIYTLSGNSYRCLVSNPVGPTPSDAAALTVDPSAPVITGHGSTRVVLNPGQGTTLTVTATGTGSLSYQWYHSGRSVAGATGSSLMLSAVLMSDGGYYNVRVTDTLGTRRSTTIFVIVAPATTHIVSWGDNSLGQTQTPSGLATAVAVAANNNASLALKADGTVIGWGDNSYGQTAIPGGLTDVVAVAVGAFHSMALKSDGTVVSWGASSYGLATTAASLTDVVAISAGFYFSTALKADGTVVTWGETTDTFYDLSVPAGLNNVVAISGTSATALALKSDGTVVTWGVNPDHQADIPIGLGSVVGIATGAGHLLALKSDGTVVAWGSNTFGQTTVPSGLTNVTAVAANGVVSFALKTDGTLTEWGTDSANRFHLPQSRVPAGLIGILEVGAGSNHAIVLCGGPLMGPSIATQTGSQTVNSGSLANFAVIPNGSAPFTYQWQRLRVGGDTWNDIVSYDTSYSGITGPTLTITVATLAMNGDQFRCNMTNIVGNVTSTAATLSVINGPGAPVITAQPVPAAIVQGNTAGFTVAATGGSALSYQWQLLYPGSGIWDDVINFEVFLGGSPPPIYNGIHSATLLVNTANANSGALNGFQFRCLVSDSAGSILSLSATLTVTTISNAVSGDFNGDNKSDIVLTNTATGERAIWLMNGTSISAGSSLGLLSLNWSISSTGDFNGDGKADLLLTNTVTGERVIWLMNGTSVAVGASLGILSTDWTFSQVGDFNGDGKSDILLTNTVTGER